MSTGELQYGDLVYRPSHPGNIAAIGHLFGLRPPAVESCRVLELGCGTGFNLMAMSLSIPGGRFTGLDLSETHIRRGLDTAAALRINNVELRCQSIDEFRPAAGDTFDYILAHGVYSWVPAATREAILSLTQDHLAPTGLALISYNTHPGWRLRGLVRDALRFFVNPEDTPGGRVPGARRGLNGLTEAIVNSRSIYSRALCEEWEKARDNPDSYLAHEHLLPENNAFYFEEFIRQAAGHKLQYVAEARLTTNSFLVDRELRGPLEEAGHENLLRREQHLDWLVGRYFRQTLLCHAGIALPPGPDPNTLLQLHIASTAEIMERTETAIRIRRQDSAEYEIADVGFRAVLELLNAAGESPVPAMTLAAPVLEALDRAGLAGPAKNPGMAGPMMAALLWSGCGEGVWTLRADAPALVLQVAEKPAACPLARLQAETQSECTNRLHRSVALTPGERSLLTLLDGTRSAAELGLRTGIAAEDIVRMLDRFAALALLTP